MDEDKIEEWVEKKLEKGISEEALRNSLEKSGYDPILVDRAKKQSQEDESRNLGNVDLSGSREESYEGAQGQRNEESAGKGKEKDWKNEDSLEKSDDETEESRDQEETVRKQKTEYKKPGDASKPPEVDSKEESKDSGQRYKRTLNLNLPTESLKKPFVGARNALSRRKRGVAGMLVLFLLVAAVPFVPVEKVSASVQSSVQNIDNTLAAMEDSDKPSENSDSETSSQAASNVTKVVFREADANPASLTVTSGTEVKFVNEQSQDYHINFERGPEDLSLKTGSSDSAKFDMTVYYTATPAEAEEPEIYGSVIVE